MQALFRNVRLITACALAAGPGVSRAQAPVGAPSAEADYRVVCTETWPATQTPDPGPAALALRRTRRGVWPVANGRIFAHVGLGEPGHRMFGITGPHYQTRGNHQPLGAFGEQWCTVLREQEALGPAIQAQWSELAGVASARTTEKYSDGTVLRVTDHALANEAAILRRFEVHVPRSSTALDWRLRLHFSDQPNGPITVVDGVARQRYRRDEAREYRLLATVLGEGPRGVIAKRESGFEVPIGLSPRGVGRIDLLLLTSLTADAESAALERIRKIGATGCLRAAVAKARAARSEWLRVEPVGGSVGRLVDRIGNLIIAQRALPGGAVAPMVHFKGVWLRDSNGPIRALLWLGAFAEARAILRYYRAASALAGATRREFPLDLPIERAPKLRAEQWAKTGTDRCEVPSFVALQHLWYWRHTGDVDLIREHYEWLRHNALHQVELQGPAGPIQPFNGDETYLHGAFYSRFPQRDAWPNEFPRADAFSADSSFVRLACYRAMAELAQAIGRAEHIAEYRARAAALVRAIDAHYWCSTGDATGFWAPARSPTNGALHRVPYAPVNLAPLWLGTHDGRDPKARQNLAVVVQRLGRAPGVVGMTPSIADGIGSLPGYYLTNLVRADHPDADAAFDALLQAASPGGAYAEIHSRWHPDWGYGDGTYPNRLRPWESGINLCAALEYLTGAKWLGGDRGIRLRPRRPKSGRWPSRVGPLMVGATKVELRLSGPGREGPEAIWLAGPDCLVNGHGLGHTHPRLTVPWCEPAEWTDRPGPIPEPVGPIRHGGITHLILTVVPEGEWRRRVPDSGVMALDFGLPMSPEDLAKYISIQRNGQPKFRELWIGASALVSDRRTMKSPRFWRDTALLTALREAEDSGVNVRWGVSGL